jgi:hypothetical protein
MRLSRLTSTTLAAGALAATLAACADAPMAPAPAPDAAPVLVSARATPHLQEGALLSCPTRAAREFTVTIDERGGSYRKHGVGLDVPAGALSGAQQFRVSIPRSSFVEADVHAVGHAQFSFARPVTVTLDYRHCAAAVDDAALLEVYYVDGARTLLERMPASDDRKGRQITFETTHLSGYAVAYRTGASPEVPPSGDSE